MTDNKETAQNNALSIIDNVNPQLVAKTMQKIAQFQEVVRNTLRDGHDYGTIPGTGSKPTLLKPGAEKILMMMGVQSSYELIERIQDYDRGFFAYTVKCTLSRNGEIITQGLGHCNSREKKYTSERVDPYTIANTCLKMAKKRAQIDATLTIASLSELFTQDIEDMYAESQQRRSRNYNSNNKNGSNGNSNNGKITEKQMKAIHAISNSKNISDEKLKEIVKNEFNVESKNDLTKQQASDLISYLNNYFPEDDLPDDIPDDLPDDDVPF